MNSILDVLMNAAGGGAVAQVGQRFGLSEDQTANALNQLIPALTAGLQRNTSQQGGLEDLISALNNGNHEQYLDDPGLLGQQSTIDDGNAILGHIFGSKDVSRAVAGQAAAGTGIGADVLKQMLPVVATMVMGALSKQNTNAQSGGGLAGDLLGALLSQGGGSGGSMAGNMIGMLGRLLGGR